MFVVRTSVIREAADQIKELGPTYAEQLETVKNMSESLIDSDSWKGKARDEFKATFRIVEHYLNDDFEKLTSMGQILEAFLELYTKNDTDGVSSLNQES